MSGKVILSEIHGDSRGTQYRFDAQMLCLVGRAENCTIQFTGAAGEGVSRHHCMLDVRPPRIYVQDLHSSNGTWLNEVNIGKKTDTPPDQELPYYELKNGDLLRIATHVFRVKLLPAFKCYVCHKVLPDDSVDPSLANIPEKIICRDCQKAGLTHPITAASKTLEIRTCVVCGMEVTILQDSEESRPAEFVCADCRLRHAMDPSSTFKIPEKTELPSNLLPLPGYRVLKRIGRGGMGEVFLAQSNETLEKVAVKVLRPDIAFFESCREDFLREAENLRPLKHPNIVELKDLCEDGEAIYLVLEYCTGGTLRSFLHEHRRPFDLRTALDLTYQILDGLDFAHNIRLERTSMDGETCAVNGIVHRDIKPENIFLSISEGNLCAKIADFGLAKAFDLAGISGCTRTGDFSGTLGFISRQQFLNYKYVRPEVDVWAAAATLYYMLTGSAPRDFSSGDPQEIFKQKPYSIQAVNSEITPALAYVLDQALDDTLALRYKTASSLKFALLDAENR